MRYLWVKNPGTTWLDDSVSGSLMRLQSGLCHLKADWCWWFCFQDGSHGMGLPAGDLLSSLSRVGLCGLLEYPHAWAGHLPWSKWSERSVSHDPASEVTHCHLAESSGSYVSVLFIVGDCVQGRDAKRRDSLGANWIHRWIEWMWSPPSKTFLTESVSPGRLQIVTEITVYLRLWYFPMIQES